MSRFLPTKDFKWNTEELTKERIMSIKDDAETGYMFKVDLHIPVELHDKFNNYVPCPENIRIKKDGLNGWQQENYNETKISKLCTTFHDKIDYVVNYRYLQLMMKLGVELLEVKQVLQFTQTPFLKSF